MVRTAIETLCTHHDARSLANTLRANQRRIIAGLYIDHAGNVKHAIKWKVFPAKTFLSGPNEGESAGSGESFSPRSGMNELKDNDCSTDSECESGASGESISPRSGKNATKNNDPSTVGEDEKIHQTHWTHPKQQSCETIVRLRGENDSPHSADSPTVDTIESNADADVERF
jgi:hypothetical protein